MAVLDWSPLTEADLPALMALAQDCLDADGGLPQLATGPYLRELFLTDVGIAGRDDTTELLAAAALGHRGDRRTATGLVHPSARRQGHGEHLVDWCQAQAGGGSPLVIAETMSIEAEFLFAASGFHRVFAESVMRHKLKAVPRVHRPDGVTTRPFGPETASDFFTAFSASFADRPAYRPVPEQEWLAELLADPTFRPRDSRVALDGEGMPVGFVIVCDGWIDQVGVVPTWRGRALGAHLVARSLTALRKAGTDRVYLCVNVDNPSRILYERLGFRVYGTRARYESRPAGASGPADPTPVTRTTEVSAGPPE